MNKITTVIVNRWIYKLRSIVMVALLSGVICSPIISYAKSPKSALKELKKKYEKIETFQADFNEVFEWAHTGEKTQRTGKIILAEGKRFRIDTEDQLIICDNYAIYRYNKLKSQVIIEPLVDNTESLIPRRMLLNFADEFKADKLTELPVHEQLGFRLDLISDKPDEVLMTSATLWATLEDKTIHRLKFSDLNGNITTYYLSNITSNKIIDPGLTTFQNPPNVEVFDLR